MGDRDHSRTPRGAASMSGSGSEDIMRLVVQREQARLQKDWALADDFRDRLGAIGVTLFDKTNSWKSTDGRTGRIPTFSEVENGAGSPDAVISMMDEKGHMQPPVAATDTEEGHIKALIRQREEARSAKDFSRSDQIRDELKAMGVDIYDKDKIWKSKSGHCGVVVGYNAGGNSSGPCPTDIEISTLVQQREKARQNSEWQMADMIRDELKQWGVDIYDKDKVWRCSDGRHGPVPPWSQPGQQMGGQGPVVGYPPQPPVPMQVNLDQLIAACVANARNPATSARTIALLQQAADPYGGPPHSDPRQHYSDPRQHYGAPPGHYGAPRNGGPEYHAAAPPRPPPPHPPPAPPAAHSARDRQRPAPSRREGSMEVADALRFCTECQASGGRVQDNEIMWLVEVREKLRRDKDYAGADNLRQAFRVNLGLEMNEKEKSWSITDGRQGEIPSWQTLA